MNTIYQRKSDSALFLMQEAGLHIWSKPIYIKINQIYATKSLYIFCRIGNTPVSKYFDGYNVYEVEVLSTKISTKESGEFLITKCKILKVLNP